MSTTHHSNRYSAEVALSLVVGEQTLPLSHVAPHFVILSNPVDLPPCQAEVVVDVDGDILRRSVFLVDGSQAARLRTPVEPTPSR